MATVAPFTQSNEGIPLTKPGMHQPPHYLQKYNSGIVRVTLTDTYSADWAHYMVTAAIKFASDTSPPISYASPDEGRLDILKTLNWYEAHDEYEWPDFSNMGYDFSQAMRFRRALINDVFLALQKAGHIKTFAEPGPPGTPSSGQQGGKRIGTSSKYIRGSLIMLILTLAIGNRRMKMGKRRCAREDTSDTVGPSTPIFKNDKFLANTMRLLLADCDFSELDISQFCVKEDDVAE
ncbi:hypothetical protein N0V83_003211 [Neocucurbitaria cava]|uniref:Uncharacterized protein n=1 Tax=Neocucurbitaria cava TaxID=798079 RepID=A0A9W8YB14_9PLEO|nr:hypothetical protein N0V83_003211 [Neocucurbitaria cava]